MNRDNFLKVTFISGLVVVMAAALLKIFREPVADVLMPIGVLLSFVFIGRALYEVITSRRINRSEKTLWTLGLLLMGGIVGLVYLFSERKRIISAS